MIKLLCCAECSVHGYINSYLVMLLQEIFISMSCSHWDIFFTSNHEPSRKTKLGYLIHRRPRRIIFYHIM